ncbi:MAG: branched-chain amino acid transaminase [Acidobacteriota bacterium]|jgi:branched-chain amino acid aminotransferase
MPGLKPSAKIWHNGELIPWDEAKIHICSHVVHYASAVFEGIRCYKTRNGSAVFRLQDHVKRLTQSAHIYRMPIEYSADALESACLETIRANEMESCYIRPIVFRGYHSLGVNPLPCPVEAYVVVWEWGKYLGEEALENGVDVMVSSWNRVATNTLPGIAKAAANYMNAQLIKMEALENGYTEGIALDARGYVSEGSGENLFMVRNGKLVTPPLSASVLPGITRDCVMVLGRELGYEVSEDDIPRESLYIADEVFFTGTAAEITPIRSIDKVPIGIGRRGPITEEIQKAFFANVEGRVEDTHGWLTPVYAKVTAEV